jgi:citrate synthase
MSASTQQSEKYWHTQVSEIAPDTVYIRGYRLEDVIGLSFTAATFLMIKGRIPTPQEAQVLDAILTAVLDYGLEKSGTAAARYVVSTNPSIQAGLATAALGAGDYGLAPENAARFITETYAQFLASGETDMDTFASEYVARAADRKERIPGFGHPVFKKVDPRAEVLKSIAVKADLWGAPAQLYEAMHRAFTTLPGRAEFPINDVGTLAAITVAMGFTPQEATALAIMGTIPGVVAHISEELSSRKVGRKIPAETVDYQVSRRKLADDMHAAGW